MRRPDVLKALSFQVQGLALVHLIVREIPAIRGLCTPAAGDIEGGCACRPLDRRVVLDKIAGQSETTIPPPTPFANCQLQNEELLSVEGNNLGDNLPGHLLPPCLYCDNAIGINTGAQSTSCRLV